MKFDRCRNFDNIVKMPISKYFSRIYNYLQWKYISREEKNNSVFLAKIDGKRKRKKMLQYCAVERKNAIFSRRLFVLSYFFFFFLFFFNRDEIDFILDFHRCCRERIERRKNKLFVVWKLGIRIYIDFCAYSGLSGSCSTVSWIWIHSALTCVGKRKWEWI